MSQPKKLPQPEALIVEENKITSYLLDLEHKQGGSKAKYFRNRGFSPQDWKTMASALRKHGATQTVTSTTTNEFGTKYEVQCTIVTPDGKNPCILTAWIQEGEKPPRLVTAYPSY
jgi:hypothetical protein